MNYSTQRAMVRIHAALALLFFTLMPHARGELLGTRNFAVELTATIATDPPEITLHWVGDQYARSYTVNRKALGQPAWAKIGTAEGNATSFVDKQVSLATGYEYQVVREGSLGYTGYGYIYSGINLPLREFRGRVLLLTEESAATALAADLKRFEFDLIGDGWTVTRLSAKRSEKPPEVKARIKAAYNEDPLGTVALLLFGNIPVPYSGNITPDEHDNHRGAWPADVYYADLDGEWTDATADSTGAERSANRNVPGDGKFDQSELPTGVELQVGRVDLSNMTCFLNKTPSRTENDLLRQYLAKDHRFRHREITVPDRAMIFDRIGVRQPEALAATAWRNFAPFVGENIQELGPLEYFANAETNSYLWSAVSAGGGYNHADLVGASDSFALHPVNVVFATFVGSYYGDWDNESNFLRAGLGAAGTLLTAAYSGKPQWLFHPMAMGETIGVSARITQENALTQTYLPFAPGNGEVHIALHGDPTLRAHPIAPPHSFRGRNESGTLLLSWGASPATRLQGYYLYKAENPAGPYQRITPSYLTATDASIPDYHGETIMLRAVAMTETRSGTYLNASQGLFFPDPFGVDSVEIPAAPTNLVVAKLSPNSVSLSWINNGVNATSIVIERRGPGEANFREIARVSGDAETFVDSTIPGAGTFSYRLAAANTAGLSSYSNTTVAITRPATASFLMLDRQTQGNWIGVYGREGRAIPMLEERLPSFVSLAVSNTFLYRTALTDDERCPQLSGSLLRSANSWVGGTPFTFQLNFTDDAVHQVALYTLSFTRLNPSSLVQVFDAVTGGLLDERSISDVQEGVYLVYAVRGPVQLRVSPPSRLDLTEVFGLFIDPLAVAPVKIDPPGGTFNAKASISLSTPTPESALYYTLDGSEPTQNSTRYTEPFWISSSSHVRARAFKNGMGPSSLAEAWFIADSINNVGFLKWDDQTSGSWAGHYGSEGYVLPFASNRGPIFADVTVQGGTEWIWQETTDDPRAAFSDSSGQNRRASAWYAANSLTVDLGIFDARSHSIAFYFLDWDNAGREQLVEVIDSNNRPSQTFVLNNFGTGRYLVINLQGNAKLRVTRRQGGNAVLNGIFFDPSPDALSDPKPLVMTSTRLQDGYLNFRVEGRPNSNFCIDGTKDLESWTCLVTNLLRSSVSSTFQPIASGTNTYFRAHYVR